MPVDAIYDTFVWRDSIVTRESLGNMTYGYLGSAMGIDDVLLYIGGGYANKSFSINNNSNSQIVKSLQKIIIFINPDLYSANNYYGDTKEDYESIKIGVEYYEKNN